MSYRQRLEAALAEHWCRTRATEDEVRADVRRLTGRDAAAGDDALKDATLSELLLLLRGLRIQEQSATIAPDVEPSSAGYFRTDLDKPVLLVDTDGETLRVYGRGYCSDYEVLTQRDSEAKLDALFDMAGPDAEEPDAAGLALATLARFADVVVDLPSSFESEIVG